uniref:Kynureninase n=1 Tax=Meloidogyne floridensis TaxID=298350 RepID=A0A915P2B5_9BILA
MSTNSSLNSHPFLTLLLSKFGHNELPEGAAEKWALSERLANWLDCRDILINPSIVNTGLEKECIYLCSNSVGLQPKCTKKYINNVLKQWEEMGVDGHFYGPEPWINCDDRLLEGIVKLVGAKLKEEVGLMNSTTVNIHVLFTSFYNPTPTKYKILLEDHAFPSDHYAIESQLRIKGLDPLKAMICLKPRKGEDCLRTEDILEIIEREGNSISILFFSAVNYYTGQLLNIQLITEKAKQKECLVGWDLSHAVANVPLYLNKWNVDIACWCNYKYACSGPGGVAGIFIHERYKNEGMSRQRLLGWWGHRLDTRFEMNNKMELSEGVAGYRMSTPSAILMAGVFSKTSMEQLNQKSILLTSYLEFLLENNKFNQQKDNFINFIQITPKDQKQRGCQLSLKFNCQVDKIHKKLSERGIVQIIELFK